MRRVERLGAAELMFLAVQGEVVPQQFGVLLVLRPDRPLDPAALADIVFRRLTTVPRMRQRVRRAPVGCGRPYWTDDPDLAPARHVHVAPVTAPGDEEAVLGAAAVELTRPLPLDRPLWAATILTGMAGGRSGVVLVVQHALADGIGGLAVLGALIDGTRYDGSGPPAPAPPPSALRLAGDAVSRRAATVAGLPALVRRALARRPGGDGDGDGADPAPPRIGRAAPCRLLQPTGPVRQVSLVRLPLSRVRDAAHRNGATVNDVVLTAVGGGLGRYLAGHGERIPGIVTSVPVATRRSTTPDVLGNEFGEARVVLPVDGPAAARLTAVHAAMRVARRTATGGPAGAVMAAAVRASIALRLFDPYMRRQRFLHTVVTGVPGPADAVSIHGAPVVDAVPLSVGFGGNVVVTFAALSYAGALTIGVISDRAALPDPEALTVAVQSELEVLCGTAQLPTLTEPTP